MQEFQKVSFELSQKDLVEAGQYFLKHTRTGRRWKWRLIIRVEICFILVVVTMAALTHSTMFGLVIFALGQLGLPPGLKNMGVQSQLGYTKNQIKVAYSPTNIEINPEAFILENEYLKLWRRWQYLELVVNNDNYLYIFTAPKTVYIVPRRAFNQEKEFVQFCKEAIIYWRNINNNKTLT